MIGNEQRVRRVGRIGKGGTDRSLLIVTLARWGGRKEDKQPLGSSIFDKKKRTDVLTALKQGRQSLLAVFGYERPNTQSQNFDSVSA